MGQGHPRIRHEDGVKAMRAARLAVLMASVLGASAAFAQILECTDARGAREYAQVCPPGTVKQRQLQRGDDAPPPPSADTKSPAQLDAEFRKRLSEREAAEAKAAEERTQKETAERNCTQARVQLKALVEGQRMQRIDPVTGERIFLGDDERAADAAQQQKLIDQWCK